MAVQVPARAGSNYLAARPPPTYGDLPNVSSEQGRAALPRSVRAVSGGYQGSDSIHSSRVYAQR